MDDTENPVVDVAVTAGARLASARVVGAMFTTGVDGSVEPNVTDTSTPVDALVPVPKVRLPRAIVEAAATTGVGGVVPAGTPRRP